MSYTKEEVIEFVQMEDVKFIRLAFCDIFGNQKNAQSGQKHNRFRLRLLCQCKRRDNSKIFASSRTDGRG